jgi:hypothetical protein
MAYRWLSDAVKMARGELRKSWFFAGYSLVR